jgi:hypothetical protein
MRIVRNISKFVLAIASGAESDRMERNDEIDRDDEWASGRSTGFEVVLFFEKLEREVDWLPGPGFADSPFRLLALSINFARVRV